MATLGMELKKVLFQFQENNFNIYFAPSVIPGEKDIENSLLIDLTEIDYEEGRVVKSIDTEEGPSLLSIRSTNELKIELVMELPLAKNQGHNFETEDFYNVNNHLIYTMLNARIDSVSKLKILNSKFIIQPKQSIAEALHLFSFTYYETWEPKKELLPKEYFMSVNGGKYEPLRTTNPKNK